MELDDEQEIPTEKQETGLQGIPTGKEETGEIGEIGETGDNENANPTSHKPLEPRFNHKFFLICKLLESIVKAKPKSKVK